MIERTADESNVPRMYSTCSPTAPTFSPPASSAFTCPVTARPKTLLRLPTESPERLFAWLANFRTWPHCWEHQLENITGLVQLGLHIRSVPKLFLDIAP